MKTQRVVWLWPLMAVVAVAGATLAVARSTPDTPWVADIHGEWVKYTGAGGDTVSAYLAFPERADAAPAVIVIHEIFGLSDWVRSVADSLAVQGFVAIAPDMLSRRGSTESLDQPRRAIRDLPADSIRVDLDATYAFLETLGSVRSDAIGVIGFCWGGARSFGYATQNPALRAVVVCYGSSPDAAAIERVNAPVLGIYGERDNRINEGIEATEAAMRTAGKTYRPTIYPGAGHGFLRTGQPADVAARAWRDVVSFLRAELEG